MRYNPFSLTADLNRNNVQLFFCLLLTHSDLQFDDASHSSLLPRFQPNLLLPFLHSTFSDPETLFSSTLKHRRRTAIQIHAHARAIRTVRRIAIIVRIIHAVFFRVGAMQARDTAAHGPVKPDAKTWAVGCEITSGFCWVVDAGEAIRTGRGDVGEAAAYLGAWLGREGVS